MGYTRGIAVLQRWYAGSTNRVWHTGGRPCCWCIPGALQLGHTGVVAVLELWCTGALPGAPDRSNTSVSRLQRSSPSPTKVLDRGPIAGVPILRNASTALRLLRCTTGLPGSIRSSYPPLELPWFWCTGGVSPSQLRRAKGGRKLWGMATLCAVWRTTGSSAGHRAGRTRQHTTGRRVGGSRHIPSHSTDWRPGCTAGISAGYSTGSAAGGNPGYATGSLPGYATGSVPGLDPLCSTDDIAEGLAGGAHATGRGPGVTAGRVHPWRTFNAGRGLGPWVMAARAN